MSLSSHRARAPWLGIVPWAFALLIAIPLAWMLLHLEGMARDDRSIAVIYRSFAPEYYRRYYYLALVDAIGLESEAESGLSDAELDALHAKVRRASLVWSEAPREELRLVGNECILAANDLHEIKGRSWLIPEEVVLRRVEQRGTFARDGDRLILTLQRLDGGQDIVHVRVEHDLIVFDSLRNMGPLFGDSVLRRVP